MNTTYQFKTMNIMEHGQSVHKEYLRLLNDLKQEKFLDFSSEKINWLLENQCDIRIMEHYHIYHDCGKPYCLVIDSEGRQHFPNHAEISKNIYNEYFDLPVVSDLIANDMMFHTLKSNYLNEWLNDMKDRSYLLASLYLTAWAELYSNSLMFGGENTDSFKIKKKQLIKASNRMFEMVEKINFTEPKFKIN